MHLTKLAKQLLDALKVDRPRHPVSPPDAPQRMAASRAVRRLFKTLRIPLAKAAPRAHMKGDSE